MSNNLPLSSSAAALIGLAKLVLDTKRAHRIIATMHFMIDAKTTTDFSAITDAFYIIFSACKPYARNMQLLITIFFSFFQTIFPDQAPRTCT